MIFNDPAAYQESIGGAENFEALLARVDSLLSERVLPEVNGGRDVLIVGHGALNSAVICRLKRLPLSALWSNGLEQCKLPRLL